MHKQLARMGVWKSNMVGCGRAGKMRCNGKGVPYSQAYVNHRGREQNRRPGGQGHQRGAGQVLEPAHAEFVRLVGGLVSECGAMGGGICSRTDCAQTEAEGTGRRKETDRDK